MHLERLPIVNILPQLQNILREHSLALLTAEPGAGKTTQVPLALLKEPWLDAKKIMILEPRRLAARSAANHMSRLLGQSVGETVGYRTRLETKVGSSTKIEVVTEGILTRILQHDPSLNEYGLVIFDEFHERHLQGDLGLALTLQTQSLFRTDLRLMIMSATIDTRTLAQQLRHAPVITCKGRTFPVNTRYIGSFESREFHQQIARTIQQLLNTEQGNILVFLPGSRAIQRIAQQLSTFVLPQHILITSLYGNLSLQAQDQAILPPPPGWRKVVLSTNIAETSLTIEGIRIVLDSGLMRVPKFDVKSGMSRLHTIPISQQSAEQRRGRAGRLEPGLCIRCWTESSHRTLSSHTRPEILNADLISLALELALWGSHDPMELFWLDPPPAGAFAQACQLLQLLGALDKENCITEHGRTMAELPLHPRLAHMVLKSTHHALGSFACDVAAILNEGDLFTKGSIHGTQTDLRTIIETYYHQVYSEQSAGIVGRIKQSSHSWRRTLRLTQAASESDQIEQIGILLSAAYPDRIAQRQSDGSRRYKLANGRLARFHQPHPLEHEEYLVIVTVNGAQPISQISIATPLSRTDLMKHCVHLIHTQEHVSWDETTESVIAQREERLGALILEKSRVHQPNPECILAALLNRIQQKGLTCLSWTKGQKHLQARINFLHRVMPQEMDWPDMTDETLLHTIDTWLAPYLSNISSLVQLQRVDLTWPLQAHLSQEQQYALPTLAPTHLIVPTGSPIALDYSSSEIPILAVRLQELFGMTTTPTVADGHIPVLIHLLSPARRPVQVTQDLKSFWRTGYAEVKKELRGRYPKHFWPDDPLQAQPTRGKKK